MPHIDLDFSTYYKQGLYLRAKQRHVGFIGGRGTGKSRVVAMKAILKSQKCPGLQQMITAPTFAQLRDSTKKHFLNVCPPQLIAYQNDADNEVGLYTESGKLSSIIFRSTDNPDSLRGASVCAVWMDEAAQSDYEAVLIAYGCLREGDYEDQQFGVASTPMGLNWMYDWFGPHQTDPKYFCVMAATRDNKFLSPQQVEDLYKLYEGAWKEQELEGKWTAFQGLVYGDLFNYDETKDNCHIGVYPYNPSLPVSLAWDFGITDPEVCLAIQQDAYGNVFVIDELYYKGIITEQMVAHVRARMWHDNVVDCVCDEARPDNIIRLNNLGIPARGGKKGKIEDGIPVVRHLLTADTTTGKNMFHIDKKHCPMLIKEFQLYRWKDKKTGSEEWKSIPVDYDNHCLDALRYWVITKWARPIEVSITPTRKHRRLMGYQLMYHRSRR